MVRARDTMIVSIVYMCVFRASCAQAKGSALATTGSAGTAVGTNAPSGSGSGRARALRGVGRIVYSTIGINRGPHLNRDASHAVQGGCRLRIVAECRI